MPVLHSGTLERLYYGEWIAMRYQFHDSGILQDKVILRALQAVTDILISIK